MYFSDYLPINHIQIRQLESREEWSIRCHRGKEAVGCQYYCLFPQSVQSQLCQSCFYFHQGGCCCAFRVALCIAHNTKVALRIDIGELCNPFDLPWCNVVVFHLTKVNAHLDFFVIGLPFPKLQVVKGNLGDVFRVFESMLKV